ncbi:uncharacterized protein BX663DRAFT_526580 [Cokeromyces recurvatus]|uniref:uncharacterized protein n=1 Tax=Cokeromyces recurvatus TaxID=90255 RepID=UPI00221E3A0C|nr:uncharacterized protein BX663DRAFT_526580 [Cokeromyces recurvatus]KAI7897955.1 hypothetical protein BX663DRAFT_526580 [Cokeromyces recurvatus]
MGGSSNPSAAAGTTLLGQRTGLETNMDKKLMNNITSDIKAMHSTDPETFEGVASKMDDTFGQNALV